MRDLQFRLEQPPLLRLVVGLVRAAPLAFAVELSAKAWRLLAPIVNPSRHQRALDNLAVAFPQMGRASGRGSRSRIGRTSAA